MVDVSVEIDKGALRRLEDLLARVEREMPNRLGTEIRRAALYICQSLKKRTKQAPKRVRPNEYTAFISPNPPKYVHSNTVGRPLLRRWRLVRLPGTPDRTSYDHYVYTKRHRGKGGRMVGGSEAQEVRELLKFHGGISRPGLAKKSWGWIANELYAASSMGDLSFKRGKGVRRDPVNAVKGVFRRFGKDAEAIISNRLDYIGAALPPGALEEALSAAVSRLDHNIQNHIERVLK